MNPAQVEPARSAPDGEADPAVLDLLGRCVPADVQVWLVAAGEPAWSSRRGVSAALAAELLARRDDVAGHLAYGRR